MHKADKRREHNHLVLIFRMMVEQGVIEPGARLTPGTPACNGPLLPVPSKADSAEGPLWKNCRVPWV